MELIAQDLACERGGRMVFAHVTFRIAGGGILVLRGRNGAGKTSLIRMIAGVIEPASGSLSLEGREADLSIGQHCHLVAHQDALKPALTVEENLTFWADFYGHGDVAAGLSVFDLNELSGLPAALLSAGQKRRLALSRLALCPRPIWLLDEPTVGLDAQSQARLARTMSSHLAEGGMIVAATHVDLAVAASLVFDFEALEQAA